jgi:GNAT superfamily N-acetyltransferase
VVEIAQAGTSPELLSAYQGLLQRVFGGHPKHSAPAIAWRYRDNPAGPVVGHDAFENGALVAHYVTVPLRANIDGTSVRGLLSLNTATAPEAQGKGLFTKLARLTYERAKDLGFAFVIGVANANSTPGFTQKLGFQLVAPLKAGFFLAPPRSLRPRDGRLLLEHSAEWLAWRISNPATKYVVRRSGEACVVLAKTDVPGVRCAAYLDRSCAPSAQRHTIGPAMFLGLDPRLTFGAPRWLEIPARLRPSPLNLIYLPLNTELRSISPDICFNFLDFDPY